MVCIACAFIWNAVPDKPIVYDVVSGDSYVVMTWQVPSAAAAIYANPGHTFFIQYRCTGDCLFI